MKRLFCLIITVLTLAPAAQADRFDEADYAAGASLLLTAKRDLIIPPGMRQVNIQRGKIWFDNDHYGLPNDSCALRLPRSSEQRYIPHQNVLLLEPTRDKKNGWISTNGFFAGRHRQWIVRDPQTYQEIGSFVCDDDQTSDSFRQLRSKLGRAFFLEINPY